MSILVFDLKLMVKKLLSILNVLKIAGMESGIKSATTCRKIAVTGSCLKQT
jgi:hypothetical protein